MPLYRPEERQRSITYNPNELYRDQVEEREQQERVWEDAPAHNRIGRQLGAAFRRETTIGSTLDLDLQRKTFDEQYQGRQGPIDLFGDDQDQMDGYWNDWEDFLEVETWEDFEFMKLRKKREAENYEEASWWATLAVQLLEPINYIPLVGPGGRLASAGRFALASAGQEALLHSTQVDRSLEESVIQTIAAGGIGLLFKGIPLPKRELGDMAKDQLAEEIGIVLRGGASDSAGAARVMPDRTAADFEQTGPAILQRTRISLNGRLAQAQSAKVREAAEALAIQSTVTRGNVAGKATSQSLEGALHAHTNRLAQLNQQFNRLKAVVFRNRIFKGGENIPLADLMRRVTRVARTGVDDAMPEITKMGQVVRQTFDDYADELRQVALLGTEDSAPILDNYINRIALPEVVTRYRDRLINMLRDDILAQNPQAGVEAGWWAERIVDNLSGAARPQSPVPSAVRNAMPKATHERVLDGLLGDPKYEMFFEQRADVLLERYIRSVAPKLESRKLGYGDSIFKHYADEIADEYNSLIRTASANPGGKDVAGRTTDVLAKERDQMLYRLQRLEDRVTGKRILDGPQSGIETAARWAKQLNFLAMLGQVLIASIADPAKVVMEFGLRRPTRVLFNVVRNIADKEFRNYSKEQLTRFGALIDLASSHRAKALFDLDDFTPGSDQVGNALDWMSQKFTRYATGGFDLWNATWKSVSAFNAMDEIVVVARKMVDGTASKNEIAELASLGIDADLARMIAQEVGSNPPKFQGINLADTSSWSNVTARDAFERAVQNRVNVTIVTPTAGDMPAGKLIDSDRPFDQLILQFKTFLIASHDKTFIRGTQRMAALGKSPQVLGGAAVAVSLGAIGNEIRAHVNGREVPDRNSPEYFYQALDRSGMLPILELYNMANAVSGNRLSSMTGLSSSRQQYQSNPLDAIAGPTGSLLKDGMAVINDAMDGDIDESSVNEIVRHTPFNNALLGYLPMLFGLKSAHDLYEEGLTELVDD